MHGERPRQRKTDMEKDRHGVIQTDTEKDRLREKEQTYRKTLFKQSRQYSVLTIAFISFTFLAELLNESRMAEVDDLE